MNRVPSKSSSLTLYELWNGKRLTLNHANICDCPTYLKKLKMNNLEVRCDKRRYVGYPKKSLGYYFYLPSEQKIVASRFIVFLEEEFMQGGMGSKIMLMKLFKEPQISNDQS